MGEKADIEGVDVTGPSDAPSLVFVHGATITRKQWLPQQKALADDFRVIAPDLPGHGAREDDTFRIDSAVDLVDRVVGTMADSTATVIGLSLGGYVATEFARRHPEKTDALVISGSSANPVGLLGLGTVVVSGVSHLATKSKRVNRGFRWLATVFVRKLNLDPDTETQIITAGFYPEPFGQAGFELAWKDFRDAFAAYPGPALVLNGQWDVLNRQGEQAHAAAAENARVEVIDGAGHVCNLERPGAYNTALRQFFASDR